MSPLYFPARARRALATRAPAAIACASAGALLVLAPVAMGATAAPTATALTATTTTALTAPTTTTATATSVGAQSGSPSSKTGASATLEQCATATIPQTERSATFAGEMTAMPGTARMEIRVDLQERAPGELQYRTVSAPGLGVWHSSAAGVKIFAHIQQVTDLSAPALYRGLLRFRWLNARGRPIKTEELRTARCEQPAPPSSTSSAPAASTAAGSAGTGSAGAGAAQSPVG